MLNIIPPMSHFGQNMHLTIGKVVFLQCQQSYNMKTKNKIILIIFNVFCITRSMNYEL